MTYHKGRYWTYDEFDRVGISDPCEKGDVPIFNALSFLYLMNQDMPPKISKVRSLSKRGSYIFVRCDDRCYRIYGSKTGIDDGKMDLYLKPSKHYSAIKRGLAHA